MVRSTFSVGATLAWMTMTLFCMARLVVDTSTQVAQGFEDVSGTYVDASAHDDCDIRATSGDGDDGTRAVTAVYRRGLLTLRVVPPPTIRALHVQTRRPHLKDAARSDFHNGLAHWDEGDLVVESAVPALPLWSRPDTPRAASRLIERFSFSRSSLTYRASYRRSSGGNIGDPFEVILAKCGR